MSYKTTCQERYNHYVNEGLLAFPHYCSVDDHDGEPINDAAICPEIDDCPALWGAMCESCPLLAAVEAGPCRNADKTT